MKRLATAVHLIGLIFSYVTVGFFLSAALKGGEYGFACGLVVVFLMLLRVKHLDSFKISKDSIEAKDEHDA